MRALVLGGSGFIGSHLVRALNGAGVPVRLLRRPGSPLAALEGAQYEEVFGDLNDIASLEHACADCDVLFHAAGYYPTYSLHPRQQQDLARQQIENVLEIAQTSGITKMVYTSSLSTIGKAPKGKKANEQTPYRKGDFPGLYYAIKKDMEERVLAAAEAGLPVVVVNPTGVFGECDVKPTSGVFIQRIARQDIPALPNGPMNVIDVRDVAQGHLRAWKKGENGQRYILGRENTTLRDFAKKIARIANVPAPKLQLPLSVMKAVTAGTELVERFVLGHERPALSRIGLDFVQNGQHFDASRAIKELGLPQTPIEHAIERALDWFRDHGYLD